jgi:hypothetical protein
MIIEAVAEIRKKEQRDKYVMSSREAAQTK